ncbi:MAG: PD-(D/E)XK nuclease family protein, partial [Lachnospiraceae bacterium]|nr:PD-(D/E)XK nuclease family protein [Lachnospiraceae bacterium]
PLDQSPLIRMISDALWVCRSGFGFDAVFSFLKNPLVTRSGGETTSALRIAEVENFALARGFRSRSGYGKAWEGGYRGFDPERLQAVNEAKDAALGPLFAFFDRMTGSKPTVLERIAALKELLTAYSIESGLERLAEDYRKESGEAVEREYEAVTKFVQDYLDRASELIGELTLTAEEFEDVLVLVLRQAELGHVPATKDRLLIGNLTRTRLGRVKKLYVLGANDGKLPVTPNGDGLINDRDRLILKECSISLAETAEENSFNNRYYLYLLLNEPSETLTLTFSAAENNGDGKLPAPIIRELRALFPKLTLESASDKPFAEVYSENSGLLSLSKALREARLREEPSKSEETRALYQWFRKSAAYAEALRQIDEGLFYRYQKELIPKELAEKLYGEVIRGSVSRLEGFAECPYRHFLQYGLRIKPRTVYQLAASDLGSIAHNSIETFFRLLKEEHKKWQEISESEQEELITRSVNKVAAEYGNSILSDSAKNSFLAARIRRIMTRTLWALSKQWSAGGFTETKSELPFLLNENAPLFELSREEGIRLALTGRIDRVDLARDGKKVYVRVIDYKSSSKELDYTKIYHGLQLQLLLYLQTAVSEEQAKAPGKEIIPAGVYYYTVQDPLVPEASEEQVESSLLAELKLKGLTNAAPDAVEKTDAHIAEAGDSTVVRGLKCRDGQFYGEQVLSAEELAELGAFSVNKAAELSGRISSGEIEAAPYRYKQSTGCDYCDFRGICGRDKRIRKMAERPLATKELKDLLGGDHVGVD